MKAPIPFRRAIDALNGEGEFSVSAVDGSHFVQHSGNKQSVAVRPYWIHLRDEAYKIQFTRCTAKARTSKEWPSQPMGLGVADRTDTGGTDKLCRFDLRDEEQRIQLAELLKELTANEPVSTDSRLEAKLDGEARRFLASETDYWKAQITFVRQLRSLVEKWRAADCDLNTCFRRHPEMRRTLDIFLRREWPRILPTKSGPSVVFEGFHIRHIPKGPIDKPGIRARRDALVTFIDLIRNPALERAQLGQCQRCRRYFFGRIGQKCCPRPRRCGSYLAAIRVTKENWRNTRKGLIAKAQEATRQWELDGVRAPWKPWVARRVRKTEKWVTRATNRGELTPPRVVAESDSIRHQPKKVEAQ